MARIRATLEPHFVLNTLNTIAGLVTEDPQHARRLLATLGDLLRETMSGADRAYRAVRDEVAWLRGFAQILESRHHGRLAFRWQVDPQTEDCRIPTLPLQPVVENAVWHGALGRPNGGNVTVHIRCSGNPLTCAIEDDGPGFSAGGPRTGAGGLQLVRRRIALEGGGASLDVSSKPGAHRGPHRAATETRMTPMSALVVEMSGRRETTW